MLNWKAYIIFISTLLGSYFHLKANIAFFHYGIEKGLPETNINSISQDSAGFIWMAGENSLYRFDGDRFKNYKNLINGSTESFFGKDILLFTDSRGVLWVGSSTGLAYLDFPGDIFTRPKTGWAKEDVHDIAEDYKGNIWMATNAGLAKLDPYSMETEWYTDSVSIKPTGKNVLPVKEINRLTCQGDGKIWFSTNQGALYLFDPVSLKTEEFTSLAQSDMGFQYISELGYMNNHLLISTFSEGFFWYDLQSSELKNEVFGSLGYTFHHFTPESDSIVWLAGNNGLFRFNIENRKYTRYTEDPGNPMSLRRSAINFVYEDRENNLWVTSGVRGVDYGLTNTPFHHFFKGESGPYQLMLPEITAIEFDKDDNMWIGYEAGYIEKHMHTPLGKSLFYPDAESNTGKTGAVLKIFSDSQNRIWFGGWNSGLQKFNPSTSTFEIVPIRPNSLAPLLKAADIRGIAEDGNGDLWISYHGIGIAHYDPATYTMELYRHNPNNTEGSLSNDWVFNICTDNEDNLWIATSHGVSKLNLEEKTFENYYSDETNPKTLNNNRVNTIFCDPAGVIWAGTDNGLNVYIPAINTFIPILSQADNSSYNISDIQSTKPGEIWASTKTGIISLSWSWNSLQEGMLSNIQFFNRKSGLLSTSFFPRSSATSLEGLIYFGGNEGIDYFNAEQVSAIQVHEPVPVITELTVDGLPVWFDHRKGKTLDLNHQHRMVSIRFAAPSFNNPEKLKYRYQLEGFDEQWHYTELELMAIYTNLPSGEFTFRVETENRSGTWIPYEAPLSLVVKPPFWNTLPFYILVLATAALFIFLIIYARSRIFLLQQKELEKIIDTRTKELLYNNAELEKINQTKNKLFSIISHDLRSPFAGVLGILELLTDEESGIEEERKTELLVMAKNSAENTFELLENLLTWAHSQMKNSVSRPVKQNLSNLLNKNIELKKTGAQQKEIELLQKYPEELEASFDRDMVNTVIRNLLNNAVKFTHPGGKIEISAYSENGEVKVSIADTGIGIDQEDAETIFYDGIVSRKGTLGEKGTGLGLVICREFVEKNAGKIWVTPNQPKGTVFHFTLPKT